MTLKDLTFIGVIAFTLLMSMCHDLRIDSMRATVEKHQNFIVNADKFIDKQTTFNRTYLYKIGCKKQADREWPLMLEKRSK